MSGVYVWGSGGCICVFAGLVFKDYVFVSDLVGVGVFGRLLVLGDVEFVVCGG